MEDEVSKAKVINVELLGQLVNSMSDAGEKLEGAKLENRIADFNKIKKFILDIQEKLKEELT